MEIRGLVEAGDRLRIGIAGDAGRKVAEIAAQRRERVDLHRDDASIAVETHAGGGVVVARLRVGEKCLGAGRGPFDRAPQQLRSPHHRRHFDREISLDPEGAADIGRNDPDLMFGNVQCVDREPAPQVVRLLGGGIERVAIARGVVVAQIRARLDRIGRQAVVVEAELHDLRRRGHRCLGLAAVPALDLEHEIAAELFMHERRAQRHGVTRGGDRGQRVVRDLHRFGRVLGGEPGVGHHRGDDVADVVHLVACEGRAGSDVHGTAVAERHRMHDGELAVSGLGPIVGGQGQQHARPRGRGPRRHRDDPRVGMRAAHEGAPDEPG